MHALLLPLLSRYCDRHRRHLHSFPTRRSSDLKAPATPWETEIDRLMKSQASTTDQSQRKVYFDQVQKIVWEQQPFIYLVNKRSEEHTSELQSLRHLVCRLLLEKKKGY